MCNPLKIKTIIIIIIIIIKQITQAAQTDNDLLQESSFSFTDDFVSTHLANDASNLANWNTQYLPWQQLNLLSLRFIKQRMRQNFMSSKNF